MSKFTLSSRLVTTVVACAWCLLTTFDSTAAADDSGNLPVQRTPWVTSRVVGSPEPPLPYTTEATYSGLNWQSPIYAKAEPGTDSLLVVLAGDEKNTSKVVRIRDTPEAKAMEVVLEREAQIIYGLEFHPDYDAGGQIFVFTNGTTGEPERKNRISRFTVSTAEPRNVVPQSERVIIEWRSMGHDGGDLVFDHDGMLYITSGDGTTDSDEWLSAQDTSNLLGGVLRIDVMNTTGTSLYAIPPDNPLVGIEGARGELWAFGLRNPWRMTIDRQSGQIWVGNNGQDLWETAHLIRRGENYGWSIYEGNHPFYLTRQQGPAPIVAPTIEHHHTEFRSLTGGVVYYGDRLPDLQGVYVYGDYGTGKIWGAKHDGDRLTFHQELADTSLQIAGFAITPGGELIVIDHGGAIHRLVEAKPSSSPAEFPRRLSETGLFASVVDHRVAPGVLSYSVRAAGWADGAVADRYLALPGTSLMDYSASASWQLPDGAVLIQTLSVARPTANSAAEPRRVETRMLTKQDGEWSGYSYRWNEQQNDAYLVEKGGEEFELQVAGSAADGGTQTWHIPSRSECLSCHSRAANFVLGISTLQLNHPVVGGDKSENQVAVFDQIGLFGKGPPQGHQELPVLTDPYDESADLELRARSYLHVNCAGCHIRAGGGNARMELDFGKPLDEMKIISEHPQHATLGIDRARLVAPGEPERSVLYQRISVRGRGQMPPLVSRRVDRRAATLFHAWISAMESEETFVRNWTVEELAPALVDMEAGEASAAGRTAYQRLGCHQCHRLSGEGGGAGPDLTGIAKRLKPAEIVRAIVNPSEKVAPEFASTVVVTIDGRVVRGRIEFETPTEIRLRTAESFAAPVTISKADIDNRYLSNQSIMPRGLLDTAEAGEIRELVAFILQDGKTSDATTP